MNCDRYKIKDQGNIIAENMLLETAFILLKALFREYDTSSVRYTIEKEMTAVCSVEDNV